MPGLPTAAGFSSQLCRTANALRLYIERNVLKAAGMNWTTFDVLLLVCREGGVETRAAAAEVGIAKGTLTGVVDVLTARGLVLRYAHPSDRRLVNVYATERGRQVVTGVQTRVRALETVLLRDAGVEDANKLAGLLRALGTGARTGDRDRPARAP